MEKKVLIYFAICALLLASASGDAVDSNLEAKHAEARKEDARTKRESPAACVEACSSDSDSSSCCGFN